MVLTWYFADSCGNHKKRENLLIVLWQKLVTGRMLKGEFFLNIGLLPASFLASSHSSQKCLCEPDKREAQPDRLLGLVFSSLYPWLFSLILHSRRREGKCWDPPQVVCPLFFFLFLSVCLKCRISGYILVHFDLLGSVAHDVEKKATQSNVPMQSCSCLDLLCIVISVCYAQFRPGNIKNISKFLQNVIPLQDQGYVSLPQDHWPRLLQAALEVITVNVLLSLQGFFLLGGLIL